MGRQRKQTVPNNSVTVFSFFETLIDANEREELLPRARNYRRTLSSFSAFLEHEDISFAQMNEKMIKGYEEWLLSSGITLNSSSLYMRNLRSVYNQAVKLGYAERSFMFEDVYTGVDTVSSRPVVSEDAIANMLKLDLSCSPSLALSRDLFVFSYCTCGMTFKEIAFLRKTDVTGDYVRYAAGKSGKKKAVRMELVAKSIVIKYADIAGDSEYVFPIITKTDAHEAYSQYQVALNYHNKKLKRLGQMIGEDIPLSHNVARNTWVKREQIAISEADTELHDGVLYEF